MTTSSRRIFLLSSISILFFIFFAVMWGYNHGRLELSLPEGQKQISIEGNSYFEEELTSTQSLSKILPSGSYTVRVVSGGESYVSVVNIPSFLQSKSTNVELKAEAGRQFVVDEPMSCFYPLGKSYVSYPCYGTLFGMRYHEPPTKTKPSTLMEVSEVFEKRSDGEIDSPDPGVIEGVFDHKGVTYVAVKNFDEFGGTHTLFRLELNQGEFDVVFDRKLDLLPKSIQFTASSNGDSLKFIPESGPYLFTGSNFENLEKTVLSTPMNGSNTATLVDSKNNLSLYSGFASEGPEDKQVLSGGVIAVSSEDTNKVAETSSTLLKTSFCFIEYICALEETGALTLYNDSLNTNYVIGGVLDYIDVGKELYILDSNGVSQLNMTDFGLEGSQVYTSTLKSYALTAVKDEVYISVQSPIGNHILLLSEGADVAADRVIAPLLESSFVEGVSINKNLVHIAVNLGERIYIKSSGLYKTDPEIKKVAESTIKKIIQENSLTTQGFTVISPRLDL